MSESPTNPETPEPKASHRGFIILTLGIVGIILYFHSSALQGVSFEELKLGQKVSYTEGQSPKGPCAENVKPI